jgi:3',5'-cyclic AMP phosphodiesterase CpdA
MHPPDLGPRLFTFAVVADTHVNERDDFSSSPFVTNRQANDRARWVFRDIAAMTPAPDFGVHLGDMVHPVPSQPTFADSVAMYKDCAALAGIRVHTVPGNHDVGDKNVSWMPADKICEPFLATYRAAFGADYYAFDHQGARFVILNSVLLNSRLPDEARQRDWLENEIAAAAGGRVFLFMHYPPYLCTPEERNHYDNIDEPARGWLLALIRQPQVEAVFAGHVHNFWYDRVGEAEFYLLPSTAFVRHDFSEFTRVDPGEEFGRNDLGKFGYLKVDVHAGGHVAYLIRSMGAGVEVPVQDARSRRLIHPKTSSLDNLGVELRHCWTEATQIAATGGVQEFNRKWARNDYPLLGLMEMGARLSKVPDIDLGEADSARRMQLLARMGHRFVVTTLGAPRAARMAADPHSAGVTAFEVNATHEGIAAQSGALRTLRAETGAAVYFSKIHTPEHAGDGGRSFSHLVKSGFTLDDLEAVSGFVQDRLAAGEIDGISVRVEADQPLAEALARIASFSERTGARVLASLKMGSLKLSEARVDDRDNVRRVAEAALFAKSNDRVLCIFDAFMDVDRGYFPRHAFIDRRFNPRPAARAFATLNALLSAGGPLSLEATPAEATGYAAEWRARAGDTRYTLCSGTALDVAASLARMPPGAAVHDLVHGRALRAGDWRPPDGPAGTLEVVLVLTA